MIHNFAECDNCGELLKVVEVVRYPDAWGFFSWSYVSGSGLDRKVSHTDRLLCPRCVAAAKRALEAVKEKATAA